MGQGLRHNSRNQGDVQLELGILGAGASGLSLALLTDRDFVLLEQSEQAGGHARSTSIDGWVFDRGPHIMFSRNELLLDCMVGSLGDNVHRCQRNNRVAIAGTFARYPLENDLAALPLPLRADAVLSLLRAQEQESDPRNLAEWFEANFGDVLVSAYFRPYNEKVWNVPLEQLSMSWADRIPRPPVDDVIRGALGEVSEGYLHQLFYSYPLHGGYSALMDAWAAGVPAAELVTGAVVTRVVPNGQGVTVETTAGEWQFRTVVSTLPLRHLIGLMPDVPDHVSEAVSRLVVNPMIVTTLGFEGRDPDQFTAVYIPDDDYPVNRVSYPSTFSPNNVPPGCFSIQAEITTTRGSPLLRWSDEQTVATVLDGLHDRGLVPKDSRLVFEKVERFDQAYVVYTDGFESDLQLATDWLESRKIVIHGRFGSHQYVNVDGCLERSIELARRLGAEFSDSQLIDRFTALGRAA